MNTSLRRMVEEKFTNNTDRQIIVRLIDLAMESPKDVKSVAQEIINEIEMEENTNDGE